MNGMIDLGIEVRVKGTSEAKFPREKLFALKVATST